MDTRTISADEVKAKYVVVNQYGIGGCPGQIHYTPRSYGIESYDKCMELCRKYDTANTMMIIDKY